MKKADCLRAGRDMSAVCLMVLVQVTTVWAEPSAALTVRTFMVAMRDGVRLATDVYLPSTDSGALPCILMRTPYGRQRYDQEVGSMAHWGYAVAIQDLRGRFDSEGEATAFRSDGWGRQQDGYDTIAWLAHQKFCNGRVGTVGASAMGIAQTLLAPADPPQLFCQYILVAPSNLYAHVAYPGGALRKNLMETYLRGHARVEEYEEVLRHPRYDDYWTAGDATAVAQRVDVPAIHYGG